MVSPWFDDFCLGLIALPFSLGQIVVVWPRGGTTCLLLIVHRKGVHWFVCAKGGRFSTVDRGSIEPPKTGGGGLGKGLN